jgi:hypothetical protein
MFPVVNKRRFRNIPTDNGTPAAKPVRKVPGLSCMKDGRATEEAPPVDPLGFAIRVVGNLHNEKARRSTVRFNRRSVGSFCSCLR